MANMKIIRSRESEEWETPQDLFDRLDREFHFTLDACADAVNTKCERYFSANHGEPKDGTYNFWLELISEAIMVSLLYWGGFF